MQSLVESRWTINRRAINRLGVLIVEDDIAILRAMEEGLAKLGFQVTCADRASDGIQLLESEHYDCVVTDLHLPGTGVAVIRRAQEMVDKPPVLVITGSDDEQWHRQASEAGAARILTKPVTPRQLSQSIRSLATAAGSCTQ